MLKKVNKHNPNVKNNVFLCNLKILLRNLLKKQYTDG